MFKLHDLNKVERGLSTLSIKGQDEDDVKRDFEMSPDDYFKMTHGD